MDTCVQQQLLVLNQQQPYAQLATSANKVFQNLAGKGTFVVQDRAHQLPLTVQKATSVPLAIGAPLV
jgi:hypothetical protein